MPSGATFWLWRAGQFSVASSLHVGDRYFVPLEFKDFAPQVVTGVVAIVTVSLSAKAFYRQRWWEQKADAYAEVLEALYHVEAYFDALAGRIDEREGYRRAVQKAIAE